MRVHAGENVWGDTKKVFAVGGYAIDHGDLRVGAVLWPARHREGGNGTLGRGSGNVG